MSFEDKQDLSHIKVGDFIASRRRENRWDAKEPQVDYDLHEVLRVTNTQIVTTMNPGNPHAEKRWNRKDGSLRGEYFVNAIEATPELISTRNAQVKARNRYTEAKRRCNAVEDGLSKRQFSVEVMEAIADAYNAAMKGQP